MSKNMEDLQEELQKLVDDGPRLDEDQAKVVKVAACLLSRHTAFRPVSSISVLLLRTTLNPEIQLVVVFPVKLTRQTAP